MVRNVLVTGCCGGMGCKVCRMLEKNGYRVLGLDIKAPSETSANFFFFKCDLTDEASVRDTADTIANELGTERLCAIIHLAGIYDVGSLVEMQGNQIKRDFEINFFGPYRINKYFHTMLESHGRIIITSSELAPLDPLPFTGIYAITKSALSKYAYSLRMELQLLGIKVVEIRPGAVMTPLIDDSQKKITAFAANTELYKKGGPHFLHITKMVEARCIDAEKIGLLILKILNRKNPKFVYCINRNPLLLLFNLLPARLQTYCIRKLLS